MEDNAGFIVHIEVMKAGLQDVDVLAPTIEAVQQRLNQKVKQASFDRGFGSPHNDRVLHGSVELACLPRKGSPKEEEQTSSFIQARHHHAGVESKIGNDKLITEIKTGTGFSFKALGASHRARGLYQHQSDTAGHYSYTRPG